MIYPMVPFPVILSNPQPTFQSHGVIFKPIDALSVLCAQLTRALLTIAKFLFLVVVEGPEGCFSVAKFSCDFW